ncbi:MAG: adenylate kinase, partial [Glaciecola sp.]
MNTVKLHDKFFKPAIKSDEIQRRIKNLAESIRERVGNERPLFLGVLNGSFRFAADLMQYYDGECDISFVKVASYEGTETTGVTKQLIGLEYSIKDRIVIIVEDIVDTGNTIESVTNTLKSYSPKDVIIATLLYKPKAYTKTLKIDMPAFEVGNDFLVGYGLDYDGLGRNLNDIYIITENKTTMMNLVLFGPPGAGKGTQAEILTEKYNLVHLSTGDVFRYNIKNDTALGQLAKGYMDKGELVPDEVTIKMLEAEVDKRPEAKGFIFDGFPRTNAQAEALEIFLTGKGTGIQQMIALDVDEDELVKRLILRGKDSGRPD